VWKSALAAGEGLPRLANVVVDAVFESLEDSPVQQNPLAASFIVDAVLFGPVRRRDQRFVLVIILDNLCPVPNFSMLSPFFFFAGY
jgi:hypothetical protein